MSDRDDLGHAWRISPSEYLQQRPATHSVPARLLPATSRCATACASRSTCTCPEGAPPDSAQRFPTIVVLTPYYRRFKVTAPGAEPSPEHRDLPRLLRAARLRAGDGGRARLRARASARATASARRANATTIARSPTGSWRSPGPTASSAPPASPTSARPPASSRAPAIRRSRRSRRCSRCTTPTPTTCSPAASCARRSRRTTTSWCARSTSTGATSSRRIPTSTTSATPGPQPVDEDPDGTLLAAAIEEHHDSFRMRDLAPEFAFREEAASHDPGLHSGAFSPYWYLAQVPGQGARSIPSRAGTTAAPSSTARSRAS